MGEGHSLLERFMGRKRRMDETAEKADRTADTRVERLKANPSIPEADPETPPPLPLEEDGEDEKDKAA